MLDSLTAVCVGGQETIIRTTNAGTSWHNVFLGSSNKSFRSVSFFNASIGFVGGDNGVLYTSDGGSTWTNRTAYINLPIMSLRCIDATTVIAVGSDGYRVIYRTIDAGLSWTTKDSQYIGPYSGLSTLENKGMLVITGGGSSAFGSKFWAISRDGGNNWDWGSSGPSQVPMSISIIDETHIYAAYNSSSWQLHPGIAFSGDYGYTWGTLYPLTSATDKINFFRFVNYSRGFFGINSKSFYTTNDGGFSWDTIQSLPSGATINGMSFWNQNNGIAFGNNGLIVRTTSGGITGLGKSLVNAPIKFDLIQNFPNPFNPYTTIRISIPTKSKVTVSVYDIMGQLVASLEDRTLESGNYEHQFDATGLSSGLYFCSVAATPISDQMKSVSKTIKMMLIK
jgi:photosystem II stability/assembly factor-like uncharacterized protein